MAQILRLPSLNYLLQRAGAAFSRFPFSIADALFGTYVALSMADFNDGASTDYFPNILMAFALGFPFSLSLTLFTERMGWSSRARLFAQLLGTLALAGYFFTLPQKIDSSPAIYGIRFVLLNVGFYFFVMFASFIGRADTLAFWHFNWALFLRLCAAFICGGILFFGLSSALLAVDYLFAVKISEKVFLRLWIVLAGVFSPWFFLAGIPEEAENLTVSQDYPKALKVLTQYILIPLVTVYLLILYAYAAKIILHWDWPKGGVSSWILGFSISAIVSLVLVYPVRDKTENVWLRTFSKWFYIALLPLLVMLFLAILRRISEYGITENRYFVLLLSFWLAGITFYFILSASKSIKIIPVSLCVLTFLSSFGPWGAFAVSRRNQVGRLEKLLIKNGVLINGKIQKTQKEVSSRDASQINSIVNYLNSIHGLTVLKAWLDQDITKVRFYEAPEWMMAQMRVSAEGTAAGKRFYFTSQKGNVVRVTGYDYAFRIDSYYYDAGSGKQKELLFKVKGTNYRINCTTKNPVLTVSKNNQSVINVNLTPWIKKLMGSNPSKSGNYYSTYDVPVEKMTLEQTGKNTRIKILVLNIHGRKSGETITLDTLGAEVFLGVDDTE